MYKKYSAHLAVFNRKKEILLVKRNDLPIWVIPGGRCEQGESPIETALREFEEETSCKLQKNKTQLVAYYLPTKRNGFFKYLFVQFINTTLSLKTTAETCDYGFFNVKNLPFITTLYERKKIKDALIVLDKKNFIIKRRDTIDYFSEIIELIKDPGNLIRLIFNYFKYFKPKIKIY